MAEGREGGLQRKVAAPRRTPASRVRRLRCFGLSTAPSCTAARHAYRERYQQQQQQQQMFQLQQLPPPPGPSSTLGPPSWVSPEKPVSVPAEPPPEKPPSTAPHRPDP